MKKWAEIGRDLGYSGKIMSSLSTSLKNSYDRWLTPYENYLRQAKPGVYQQLEFEYGGPLTPSPAPSPMKRSAVNTPSSLRGDSPARNATESLQASFALNPVKQEHERDMAMSEAPTPTSAPAPTSGFTPINSGGSGGFTAVNAGFTSINRPLSTDTKSFTPPKQYGSPMSSAKNTPDFRPSSLGLSNPLKRQLSSDSLDISKKENGTDKEESENGSRRSKRLKSGKCFILFYATAVPWSTPRSVARFDDDLAWIYRIAFLRLDHQRHRPMRVSAKCLPNTAGLDVIAALVIAFLRSTGRD